MNPMGHLSGSSRRIPLVTILLCILITACGPSIKRGTVLREGTVTGVEISAQGESGASRLELAVKLDDGTEVKAVWWWWGKLEPIEGRRVEVEQQPSEDSKLWRVIRTLELGKEGDYTWVPVREKMIPTK